MLIDRQMQSAFLPEVHRWISKLTARYLQLACPPGDLLISMVKETVILYKKELRKMKKIVSLIDLKEMKTRNDCEIACDCVKLAEEAQWQIGYGVGLRIKRSSVRIRPWPLR